ncbi:MAG: DUF4143 domain-containing protein [Rectinemataceae bacterium]
MRVYFPAECDSVNTVKAWLSLIEAARLVFRLPPWHKNITSRLVKSPKLYWHDTSLLCRLLGLRSPEDLRSHPLRGAVFENLVVADRFKAATHRGAVSPARSAGEILDWRSAFTSM